MCPLPDLLVAGSGIDALLEIKQAGEYACHVSIHDSLRLIVGEGCHRTCGVGADARQGADLLEFLGKAAVVIAGDCLGRSVQITGAAVVAESFPGLENFLLGGLGHRAWRGVEGHEAFIVAPVAVFITTQYGGDLSLLQHDF